MLRFIIKRLVQGAITVWFIATATFVAMHAVPGDPLRGERLANENIRANLMARYGLDKPLTEQYVIYIGGMLRGDFGISFTQQNRRVNDIIREREVHDRIGALGFLAEIRTPAETAHHLAEEAGKFRRIVEMTGIAAQ